jgi:sugar lactone lactonase YvrE
MEDRMSHRGKLLPLLTAAVLALSTPTAALAAPLATAHDTAGRAPVRLVAGLQGGAGSTVGPDGALYVTESRAGRVSRVDPRTGRITTFASGLPPAVIDIGGAVDVAFLGRTAYVLVTLVGPDVGGNATVGVYRVDGPHAATVIADVGAWSLAHPPATDFFVPTGVQYAIHPYRGALLITDGHHNRVLRVSRDGRISEVITFGNIVPTGLETSGNTVYLAQAGPIPHLPETGKVVSFRPGAPAARDVAAGGRLLVDVELGRRHTLYALAQGVWPLGNPEGSPASPDTGQLLRVGRHGSFRVIADRLNQPTSLEIVGDTAYVVTLGGEIWKIRHV